jgi:hypothetical protein
MSLLRQIKKLSITDYLIKRGLSPVKSNSKFSLFSSPFSSDSDPSFYVYEDRNRFMDFSTGNRGSIIDLVILMERYEGLSEAINHLCGNDFLQISSPSPKKHTYAKKFNYTRYLEDDK